MEPSRRSVVSLAGTTLALGSGCSALGERDSEQTTSTPFESFEAELHGPETTRALFSKTDIASVDQITESGGTPGLPVTLTDEATETVTERFRTAGVAENPNEFEIVQRYDGTTRRLGIEASLADSIAEGDWDGEFLLTFEDRKEAETVRAGLTSA